MDLPAAFGERAQQLVTPPGLNLQFERDEDAREDTERLQPLERGADRADR